jgi:hypothetical protein
MHPLVGPDTRRREDLAEWFPKRRVNNFSKRMVCPFSKRRRLKSLKIELFEN